METIIGHRFCTLAVACVLALLACSKETIKITDPAIVDGVLTMDPKTNHEIGYTVTPEGTAVHWKSSDLNIVSVTQDILMALMPGTVKITGETESGSVTAFTVNVRPYDVTSFKIPETFSLYVDQKVEFPVTNILPVEAGPSSLLWHAGEGGVLEWVFEGDKMFLIGAGAGKTELFAKTSGATVKEESCYVTVKEPTLKLSSENIGLLAGETAQLTITQNPNGLYKNFEWSTSDATVAKVVGNGDKATVTAGSKAGSATISVKAGRYTLTAKVTIYGEDFTPCIKTPRYADQDYRPDKWPCSLIHQEVYENGATLYFLPSDVINTTVDGYAFTEYNRAYTDICFDDGSAIPSNLLEKMQIKYDDPKGAAFENYIWSGKSYFHTIFDHFSSNKVTWTLTNSNGKSSTFYFVPAVRRLGLSLGNAKNFGDRQNVATVVVSGTMTLNLSEVTTERSYMIDLCAMENQGYSVAAIKAVSSSNTSVAVVTNFADKCAGLSIVGKGTTKIALTDSKGNEGAFFMLVIK